jgi:hypothetical protein
LDEVPDEKSRNNVLNGFYSRLEAESVKPGHKIVLTERAGSRGSQKLKGCIHASLEPLSPRDSEILIERTLGDRAKEFEAWLKRGGARRVLLSTPLTVAICIALFREQVEVPLGGLAGAYEQFVVRCMRTDKAQQRLSGISGVARERLMRLVAEWAHASLAANVAQARSRFVEAYKTIVGVDDLTAGLDAPSFINRVGVATGLFTVHAGSIEWWHLEIRNFLIAYAVLQRAKGSESSLLDFIDRGLQSGEESAAAFLMGLVSRQDSKLATALEEHVLDQGEQNVRFLCTCLQDGIQVDEWFVGLLADILLARVNQQMNYYFACEALFISDKPMDMLISISFHPEAAKRLKQVAEDGNHSDRMRELARKKLAEVQEAN